MKKNLEDHFQEITQNYIQKLLLLKLERKKE